MWPWINPTASSRDFVVFGEDEVDPVVTSGEFSDEIDDAGFVSVDGADDAVSSADEMCGVGCSAGEGDDAGFSVEEAGGTG